jgi:hypothetical protein
MSSAEVLQGTVPMAGTFPSMSSAHRTQQCCPYSLVRENDSAAKSTWPQIPTDASHSPWVRINLFRQHSCQQAFGTVLVPQALQLVKQRARLLILLPLLPAVTAATANTALDCIP